MAKNTRPTFADLHIGQQVFHGTVSINYPRNHEHIHGLATVTGITRNHILTDVAAWSKLTGRKVGMSKASSMSWRPTLLRVASSEEAAEYKAMQAENERERQAQEQSEAAEAQLRSDLNQLMPSGIQAFRCDAEERGWAITEKQDWAIGGLTAEDVKKVAVLLHREGIAGVVHDELKPE